MFSYVPKELAKAVVAEINAAAKKAAESSSVPAVTTTNVAASKDVGTTAPAVNTEPKNLTIPEDSYRPSRRYSEPTITQAFPPSPRAR